MSEITTEYKGYKIDYAEDSNEWYCNAIRYHSHSLSDVKKAIDRLAKKENSFTRCKAFLVNKYNLGGGMKECEVTSITDNGEAWVNTNGNRSKERLENLKDYEGNLVTCSELNRLGAEIEERRKQMVELVRNAKPFVVNQP